MRIGRFMPMLVAMGLTAGMLPRAGVAQQGVTYTSTSTMKGTGVIGMAIKLGGGGGAISTTTFVAGHKLRTDHKDNSTIIDVDGGRFITLNHKDKTYSSMTFEQMAAAYDQALANAKAEQAKNDKEKAGKKPEDSKYEMDYSHKVDPTGEHQRIAGYDATRTFLTITMGAHEKGQAARSDEGQMVMLVDTWGSTSAPNATAMREFQRAYAARMGREFASPMRSMEALFTSNPQMREGMAAAGKELAKQQGVPLRSTMYFIAVPEGKTLDRQAAVSGGAATEAKAEQKEDKPKGGLFGKLKAAAEAAEKQSEQEQKGAPKDAQQATLFSMLTEVQDIKAGVPADAFSIPAGYREVKPDLNRVH